MEPSSPTTPRYDQARLRINRYSAEVLHDVLRLYRKALRETKRIQAERGEEDQNTFRQLKAIERMQDELKRVRKEMDWG